MYIWKICGGKALRGSLRAQGAKNSVLPIMAASILAPCETELINCPELSDVQASARILRRLGCFVEQSGDTIYIDSRGMCRCTIPEELMRETRSSFIFLGAVLARCGQVMLTQPGGCEIGQRPVDLHMEAIRMLGAEFDEVDSSIFCSARRGLHGAHIHLPFPSVGATENAMLAACAARGETVITNAACEPEIVDLQGYMRQLGAEISGAGTSVIQIRGFSPVKRAGHRIMPDRIEAVSFLCAAAATGGDVEISGINRVYIQPVADALYAMGCAVTESERTVRVRSQYKLRACPVIETGPYPAFPTDAQPLLMAASLCAEGTSVFIENVFTDRFQHVRAFRQLGADVRTEGRTAIVSGVADLCGTTVRTSDLRGGAALLIAALRAHGESAVIDNGYILRGYDSLDARLRMLGADVEMYRDVC